MYDACMTTNNSSGMVLSKVFRIFSYLVAVAVAVELVIGLVLLNNAWERRDTWNRGQATVSALEKVESSSDAGETWRPIFSLSAGGKEYSISSSSSSNPPAYRVGEQVEMLYPDENPAEAVTNTFAGLYILPCAVLGMTAMESVLALAFFLISCYLRRRSCES